MKGNKILVFIVIIALIVTTVIVIKGIKNKGNKSNENNVQTTLESGETKTSVDVTYDPIITSNENEKSMTQEEVDNLSNNGIKFSNFKFDSILPTNISYNVKLTNTTDKAKSVKVDFIFLDSTGVVIERKTSEFAKIEPNKSVEAPNTVIKKENQDISKIKVETVVKDL